MRQLFTLQPRRSDGASEALNQADARKGGVVADLASRAHNSDPNSHTMMHPHHFQISEIFSPIVLTPDMQRALLLLNGWTIFCKSRDGGSRFDCFCVCPCAGREFNSLKKSSEPLALVLGNFAE